MTHVVASHRTFLLLALILLLAAAFLMFAASGEPSMPANGCPPTC